VTGLRDTLISESTLVCSIPRRVSLASALIPLLTRSIRIALSLTRPRSPPFSRTRKSTGLMVSFIISYTLAVLSVRVRPKNQPLFTLSPSFLQLSVFQAMFPLPLIPFLMYINRKMLLATCTSKYFTYLRFPIHIFLSND